MKIVINGCFGGFHLSPLAETLIAKKKGIDIKFKDGFDGKEISTDQALSQDGILFIHSNLGRLSRDDADLVSVVEEIGEAASTSVSELYVVEIPDDVDWVIDEYDGMEIIAEKHRTWSAFD